MDFKECLENDLEDTFLNLSEFGEVVTINGKEMTVVRDDELLQEAKSKFNKSSTKGKDTDGLARGIVLIHVKASQFEHIPQVEKLMELNSKEYRIINVSEQLGMLSIMLDRYSG